MIAYTPPAIVQQVIQTPIQMLYTITPEKKKYKSIPKDVNEEQFIKALLLLIKAFKPAVLNMSQNEAIKNWAIIQEDVSKLEAKKDLLFSSKFIQTNSLKLIKELTQQVLSLSHEIKFIAIEDSDGYNSFFVEKIKTETEQEDQIFGRDNLMSLFD